MLHAPGHRSKLVWRIVLLFAFLMPVLHLPYSLAAQEKPAATETTDAQNTTSSTALGWIIHTSGWIGGLLLVISIFFIANVIQLFMELRQPIVAPPELLAECEILLVKRDFQGIYQRVKQSPSELGQLLASGMVALSTGLNDAREAIDRQGEVMTVGMEKRISMLAVVGTLGPLIGLLGTLKGMITSFSVIARANAQMKPSDVAGGISEALILTFEGVGLSVPAIYFFALFKNRVAALSVQTMNTADEFIRRLYAAAQKKPSTESAS